MNKGSKKVPRNLVRMAMRSRPAVFRDRRRELLDEVEQVDDDKDPRADEEEDEHVEDESDA